MVRTDALQSLDRQRMARVVEYGKNRRTTIIR